MQQRHNGKQSTLSLDAGHTLARWVCIVVTYDFYSASFSFIVHLSSRLPERDFGKILAKPNQQFNLASHDTGVPIYDLTNNGLFVMQKSIFGEKYYQKVCFLFHDKRNFAFRVSDA